MKPIAAFENPVNYLSDVTDIYKICMPFLTCVSKSGILMPDRNMYQPLTKLIKFVVVDCDA